jgi:hypothetical protein
MPTDFYAKTPIKIDLGIFSKAQCVKFSRIAREIHAPNRPLASQNLMALMAYHDLKPGRLNDLEDPWEMCW